MQQLISAVRGAAPQAGLFEQQVVVGGQTVIVRGAVVNGVIRVGTAFTP